MTKHTFNPANHLISNEVLAQEFSEMTTLEKQALFPHERAKYIRAKEDAEKAVEFNNDPFGVFKASKREIKEGINNDEDSRW
jgi:hypothetical protein